jgi:hypothetical protein
MCEKNIPQIPKNFKFTRGEINLKSKPAIIPKKFKRNTK